MSHKTIDYFIKNYGLTYTVSKYRGTINPDDSYTVTGYFFDPENQEIEVKFSCSSLYMLYADLAEHIKEKLLKEKTHARIKLESIEEDLKRMEVVSS